MRAPTVVITGGGGYGALALATLDNGSIATVEINGDNHGRSYFNIDTTNIPTASIDYGANPLEDQEKDAVLDVAGR